MLYTETGALMTEHIKFEFLLHPEDWDQPPHASILVDGVEHWLADTVIEEAHTMFENLTEVLNTKFNRTNTFLGISIWRDT